MRLLCASCGRCAQLPARRWAWHRCATGGEHNLGAGGQHSHERRSHAPAARRPERQDRAPRPDRGAPAAGGGHHPRGSRRHCPDAVRGRPGRSPWWKGRMALVAAALVVGLGVGAAAGATTAVAVGGVDEVTPVTEGGRGGYDGEGLPPRGRHGGGTGELPDGEGHLPGGGQGELPGGGTSTDPNDANGTNDANGQRVHLPGPQSEEATPDSPPSRRAGSLLSTVAPRADLAVSGMADGSRIGSAQPTGR